MEQIQEEFENELIAARKRQKQTEREVRRFNLCLSRRNSPGLFHKKGILHRPRLRPHRHRGVRSAAIVLVLARHREGVAENSLEDQPVRSGREAISGTKFNIEVFHF